MTTVLLQQLTVLNFKSREFKWVTDNSFTPGKMHETCLFFLIDFKFDKFFLLERSFLK